MTHTFELQRLKTFVKPLLLIIQVTDADIWCSPTNRSYFWTICAKCF